MTHQEQLDHVKGKYLYWFDRAYTAKNDGKSVLAARWFERGNYWLDVFEKLAAE